MYPPRQRKDSAPIIAHIPADLINCFLKNTRKLKRTWCLVCRHAYEKGVHLDFILPFSQRNHISESAEEKILLIVDYLLVEVESFLEHPIWKYVVAEDDAGKLTFV